jgi:cobalamin transport system substrate-binding protein
VGAAADADWAASRIETQIAAVSARVAGRPPVKTLLVIGREPGSLRRVQASGGYGFLHDLLTVAGGADALADIRRESVEMSSEMIIARAPDAIVELHYGAALPAADADKERRVWNALSSVPAVKNKRVYLLVGDEFVVPGPRLVLAADELGRVLHPEAFR